MGHHRRRGGRRGRRRRRRGVRQGAFGDEPADLYDKAIQVVMRDKKASTSYIQRRLQIGYNKAASLIERMEREG
ncbi:DNA translocase FtsK, partial [Morganella morganii]|uniref:DNA translocase FtsK n=1 Tax=Morganella morganii TaxID=582 RepID=UPI001953796D